MYKSWQQMQNVNLISLKLCLLGLNNIRHGCGYHFSMSLMWYYYGGKQQKSHKMVYKTILSNSL